MIAVRAAVVAPAAVGGGASRIGAAMAVRVRAHSTAAAAMTKPVGTTSSDTAARTEGPGNATDPVLLHLRSATGPAHDRVEARLFPSGLQSRADYHRLLSVLLALHAPWEARFLALSDEFRAMGIDVSQRRKVAWLEEDLAALEAELPELRHTRQAASAWTKQSGVSESTLPAAFGAFYVLEGSILGGRFLAPQVHKHIGAAAPTRFFTAYGSDTGKMWKAARAAISRAAQCGSDQAAAEQQLVASAVATFEQLDTLVDAAGWLPAQPAQQQRPHA